MFVATCLNVNNQLYLLVIRVLDSEDNDGWKKFMTVKLMIGDRPKLIIISNKCTSIKRAISKVLCFATHDVCFYHVKDNIKSKFRLSKII